MKKDILIKELNPLYEELKEIAGENDSLFCVQIGDKFPDSDGIIFYGRATNGWEENCELTKSISRENQLKWVEDYNTKRSAFSRIIKGISMFSYPEKWYDYVAWSNVCKIAPTSGGNPSDKSYYQQLEVCRKIFSKEIEILSPKHVILLTGWSWAKDFLTCLNGNIEPELLNEFSWEHYNMHVCKINSVNFIIADHPRGKPESRIKGTILEVMTEKLNSISKILTQEFPSIEIQYYNAYAAFFFRPYKYWIELWHDEKHIYLYLCSYDKIEEQFEIANIKFKHERDNDNNDRYFYYSDISEFEYSNESGLIETLKPILQELSKYSGDRRHLEG
jgi:hypothetical protein